MLCICSSGDVYLSFFNLFLFFSFFVSGKHLRIGSFSEAGESCLFERKSSPFKFSCCISEKDMMNMHAWPRRGYHFQFLKNETYPTNPEHSSNKSMQLIKQSKLDPIQSLNHNHTFFSINYVSPPHTPIYQVA